MWKTEKQPGVYNDYNTNRQANIKDALASIDTSPLTIYGRRRLLSHQQSEIKSILTRWTVSGWFKSFPPCSLNPQGVCMESRASRTCTRAILITPSYKYKNVTLYEAERNKRSKRGGVQSVGGKNTQKQRNNSLSEYMNQCECLQVACRQYRTFIMIVMWRR